MQGTDPSVELSVLWTLTAVVFGCHPDRPAAVPEAMSGLFPFYFPIPILDRS